MIPWPTFGKKDICQNITFSGSLEKVGGISWSTKFKIATIDQVKPAIIWFLVVWPMSSSAPPVDRIF